jgi:hypothetical protein
LPFLVAALWASALLHAAVLLLGGRFVRLRPPPGPGDRDGVVELAWVEGAGDATAGAPGAPVDEAPPGGALAAGAETPGPLAPDAPEPPPAEPPAAPPRARPAPRDARADRDVPAEPPDTAHERDTERPRETAPPPVAPPDAPDRVASPTADPSGAGPTRIGPSGAGSSDAADAEADRARAAVRALILGSAGALPTSVEAQRALLPAATTCPQRVAGVWRAQRYAPLQGLWVRFTLRVEERDDGTLAGTIRSRIWSGTAADRRPPPCGPGQIDTEHEMPARGRVDGDRITFGSRTHRLVADRCPQLFGRMAGYAPDNFSGTLDEARQEFQSVNNDGAYDVNTPYVFRRTACLAGGD